MVECFASHCFQGMLCKEKHEDVIRPWSTQFPDHERFKWTDQISGGVGVQKQRTAYKFTVIFLTHVMCFEPLNCYIMIFYHILSKKGADKGFEKPHHNLVYDSMFLWAMLRKIITSCGYPFKRT